MKRLPIKITAINTIPIIVRTAGLNILKGLISSMMSIDQIKAITINTEKKNTLIEFETAKGSLYCLNTPALSFEFLFNRKIKSCRVPNWQAQAKD